jgi:hypothetical protein
MSGDLVARFSVHDELQNFQLARAQFVSGLLWRLILDGNGGSKHAFAGGYSLDGRRQFAIRRAFEDMSARALFDRATEGRLQWSYQSD